jgi:prefoldin subunit 5
MNIWHPSENKYIAEATYALEKAKYDLSMSKLDLLKLENDIGRVNYHLNLIISNIRALRRSAAIINIEEFRKIQREAIHLRNQQCLGKKLAVVAQKTIKSIEERIAKLTVEIEKLHNNILELPSENKRS